MINFKTNRTEQKLITQIAQTAVALAKKHGINYKMMDADMDITACHCNGMPLDLVKLLNADEFNFAHDVFGIRQHIDRNTGKITRFFVPRCSNH